MPREFLKRNGIRVLDRYSRTRWFRFLSPINFTLWKAIEKAAAEHAKGSLLDAGAGRRPYANMLREVADGYSSVDQKGDTGAGIDHVVDLHKFDLERRFDTILCSQVLEHCRDPETVLRRLAEHLNPEGRIILTVPHLSMLHNEPADYFRFTEYGLRVLLDSAGLEAIEIRKVGGFWVFFGHLVSTLAVNTVYGIPLIGGLAVYANAPVVGVFVVLDRLLGFRGLLPVNHLVVAKRLGEDKAKKNAAGSPRTARRRSPKKEGPTS
jgi:SAM-dependent methyltransferase